MFFAVLSGTYFKAKQQLFSFICGSFLPNVAESQCYIISINLTMGEYFEEGSIGSGCVGEEIQ